jgi:integrase
MARRSPGEGSVYKRKDGYWVAQYGGKYCYAKTKKEAKRKLLELLKAGEDFKPENITVGLFMDRWLGFAKPSFKPATVKRYREAIEVHIKPALGDTKMHKVNSLRVQELYARMLRAGLSPATVNLVHSVLSSGFKRAVKWQVVQHNVCKGVDAPRIEREEVDISPLKRHARCSRRLLMTA